MGKFISRDQHERIVREIADERDELLKQLGRHRAVDILDRIREARRGDIDSYTDRVLADAEVGIQKLQKENSETWARLLALDLKWAKLMEVCRVNYALADHIYDVFGEAVWEGEAQWTRVGGNAPESVTITPEGQLNIPPDLPVGNYEVTFERVESARERLDPDGLGEGGRTKFT